MRTKEGNKEKDILEAAIKVFAEYGFYKSKISKIAEVANVAAGSVYVYYKNKEDILQKIYASLWEKMFFRLSEFVQNTRLSPDEKLDGMFDLVFDIFTQNPSMALVVVNEEYHMMLKNPENFTDYYEKFLDLCIDIVCEGQSAGRYSKDLDITILRYYIFGAIRYLLQIWANEPEKYDINKIRSSVKYIIKYGITK